MLQKVAQPCRVLKSLAPGDKMPPLFSFVFFAIFVFLAAAVMAFLLFGCCFVYSKLHSLIVFAWRTHRDKER